MAAPTKILHWSPEEAESRIGDALEIMERLDVDELHWEAVFRAVSGMLASASLQQSMEIPIQLPGQFPGRK